MVNGNCTLNLSFCVKYGKLGEKLYASEKDGIKKLSYSKIHNDFEKFCMEKNINCCSLKRFISYVKAELNVGLKTPRSDQCNICFNLEIQIKNESDLETKKQLELDLKEHKKDASLVRDFIFWSFQKSYQQQGEDFRDTDQLELYEQL